MVRDPLRTLALADALTKGEFRGLEWAVSRARRDSDAFGTRPDNALSAIRKLKQQLGTPRAEADLMSVKEQRGLTWAVERATKDSDGYASEALAARSAIAKLHATIKFEQKARLAGHHDWAFKLEERHAPGGLVSPVAMRVARETRAANRSRVSTQERPARLRAELQPRRLGGDREAGVSNDEVRIPSRSGSVRDRDAIAARAESFAQLERTPT